MNEDDEMRLTDRVAIVTGAGQGIGRGIAHALAKQGATVVVTGRTGAKVRQVASELDRLGASTLWVAGDVSSSADADRMVAQTLDRFGRVDILVNNAAIQRPGWSWTMSDEDFDAVLRVNLIGTFNMVRASLKPMKRGNYGRIINITSIGALGHPLQAAYAASKAGVIGLTYACALELQDTGVTINAFGPVARTRMALASAGMTDDEISSAPIHDAPFITFLASEHSANVNGQLFMHIPGGFALYRKPSPIAEMTKEDSEDAFWSPDEIADRFVKEFEPVLVPPGYLSRARTQAYIDKMIALIEAGKR